MEVFVVPYLTWKTGFFFGRTPRRLLVSIAHIQYILILILLLSINWEGGSWKFIIENILPEDEPLLMRYDKR